MFVNPEHPMYLTEPDAKPSKWFVERTQAGGYLPVYVEVSNEKEWTSFLKGGRDELVDRGRIWEVERRGIFAGGWRWYTVRQRVSVGSGRLNGDEGKGRKEGKESSTSSSLFPFLPFLFSSSSHDPIYLFLFPDLTSIIFNPLSSISNSLHAYPPHLKPPFLVFPRTQADSLLPSLVPVQQRLPNRQRNSHSTH